MSLPYHQAPVLDWPSLSGALANAEDALARLDQTLAKSPIRAGWSARSHFADATASLWLDGSLVSQEDLVLHDARMDVRTPSHDLVRAHTILRARRSIGSAADPAWALSRAGLDRLRGRALVGAAPEAKGRALAVAAGDAPVDVFSEVEASEEGAPPSHPQNDSLAAELAAIDALIARSDRVLAGALPIRREPENRDIILYDLDWDEEARLAEWREVVRQSETHPPVLAAVLAAQAWAAIEPLQHAPWLGRLLVPALLQARDKTRSHLLCLNSGLKRVPRTRRTHREASIRLLALIEAVQAAAEQGLRDHDRWLLARALLQRKLVGRRSSSKLPALIELVMARPLVSTGIIAAELGITPRGAQDLVAVLGLREATGRERYRAWGVL